MGNRNIGKREKKKQKKDGVKPLSSISDVEEPQIQTEVIKKSRKKPEEEL